MALSPRLRTLAIAPVIGIVGAGGIMAQVLLVREFILAGGGNELTMGVVLANWLLLEAIGAYLGERPSRDTTTVPRYVRLLMAFSILLPLTAILAHPGPRLLFGIGPGESVNLAVLALSSLVITAPVSIVHGATFPAACRVLEELHIKRAIGYTYLYETLGTLLGGVLLTLAFSARVEKMEVVLAIALGHLAASLLVYASLSPRRNGAPRKAYMLLVGIVLLLLFTVPQVATAMTGISNQLRWTRGTVLESKDTPYGNITVLQHLGEKTVYYDGEPTLTAPNPDTTQAEDFAHIAMSAHPDPARVLLLTGGLGGMARAILAHPIDQLVYVDVDPDLPGILSGMECTVLEDELSDERLHIEHQDARMYVSREKATFDLIIVGFIDPTTLQSNRLFTSEFFASTRSRLQQDGILALSIDGAPAQMHPGLIDLNASIAASLQQAYPYSTIIPGERNILLAGQQPLGLDTHLLTERLGERDADPGFMDAAYIAYRLDDDRKTRLEDSLSASTAGINLDMHPRGLYYALAHWGAMFSPGAASVLQRIERVSLRWLVLPLLGVAAVLALRRHHPRTRRHAITYAIWTSGVAGMAFDLLILFVFQVLYGFVYSMLGALMAGFMVGLYFGGHYGVGVAEEEAARRIFLFFEVKVLLLLPALFLIANALGAHIAVIPQAAVFGILFLFAATSGIGVGAQFPLAATLVSGRSSEGVAGPLYAADLMGGWLGGLVIAILTFPLWGLLGTVVLLIALKASSLFGLLVSVGEVKIHGSGAP